MLSGGELKIDVAALKESVKEVAVQAKNEEDFDRLEAALLKKHAAEDLPEKPKSAAEEAPDAKS